jgi:hypothetical protein
MPIWRPAHIVGNLISDAARNLLAALLVVALGLVMGFRPEAGVAGVVAGVGLLLVFAFGISWVWATLGLVLRTAQTVSVLSFLVQFPLTFASNVFVDPDTMPEWLARQSRPTPRAYSPTPCAHSWKELPLRPGGRGAHRLRSTAGRVWSPDHARLPATIMRLAPCSFGHCWTLQPAAHRQRRSVRPPSATALTPAPRPGWMTNRLSCIYWLGTAMSRLPAAAALAVVLLAVSAASAVADSPRPWQPYEGSSGGYTLSAGTACDFQLSSTTLEDKERYRVVETWPDGSTKREEWTGQLVVEFTNDATGESVRRNLTGRGDFTYGQDGSWSLINMGGHFAAVLYQGDDPGPGVYVVRGKGFSVSGSADGHRVLDTSGNGTLENVCQTLAS